MRMFVKQAMSKKRLVLMVNFHCKYITHYFPCLLFQVFVVSISMLVSFSILRYVEGRNTVATLF